MHTLTLIADGVTIGPAELAERVARRRSQLGGQRALIVLEGGNDLEFVVTYLAARACGHPLVLSGAGAADPIVDRYDPDIVVATDRSSCHIDRRRRTSAHDLNPDLALLMSTSGSTGNPKLVRLSATNLDANARSIAEYQHLTGDDVGVTSLPLHYCYGLSVLNAHHVAGASLVLTDLSVVDQCFWHEVECRRVTNLAGVPHTFEMIAHAGHERLQLDHLRLVTVAGGRMDPDRVRSMADLGQQYGWEFLVMYGQTEATARIAYLPAELAADHPDRVGLAVPGGRIEIRPCPDLALPDGHGEVVYLGPNVMMGYAETSGDLSRGAELDELRTGDLGRIDERGLLEIVGRRNNVAKLFGLRIDLTRVERQLAEHDVVAICASDDARLVVAVERLTGAPSRAGSTAALVASLTSLPVRSIDVWECDQLPRLANGKPDVAAILRCSQPTPVPAPRRVGDTVESIFADVLNVSAIDPHDTFASLGGDSFSYVEVSIRLESLLGHLPPAWHLRSVASLTEEQPRSSTPWFARIETSVLLRALAIVTIVITHMRIARVPAGAHILLAVVGFNFARFQVPRLATADRRRWWRSALAPLGRLAAITSAWTGVQMLLSGGFGWTTLLLINNYAGAPQHEAGRWRYWFFESIIVMMLSIVALFALERVRRFARRRPFVVPMLLLIPAAALRFEVVRLVDRDYNYVYRPDTIVWCFLLGWSAAAARSWWQRSIVSVAAVMLAYDYFGNPDRDVRVMLAVSLLAWLPVVLVPRPLARPIGWLASASMWIFMTHWTVWPVLTPWMPRLAAMCGTVVAGVALWVAWRAIAAHAPAIELGRWRPMRLPAPIRHAERFRIVEHV